MDNKKINKRGRKALKKRENFRQKLIQKIANQTDDIKEDALKIYDFLLQSINLNDQKNPILLYDGNKGNISDDSCSGHGKYGGKMYCWDLEKNSKTSKGEISLADVFDSECWERSSISQTNFERWLRLAKIFNECGLCAYFVKISTWRKGYDYHVYSLSGDINHIIEMNVNYDDDCFRIYIEKGKTFKHNPQIDN